MHVPGPMANSAPPKRADNASAFSHQDQQIPCALEHDQAFRSRFPRALLSSGLREMRLVGLGTVLEEDPAIGNRMCSEWDAATTQTGLFLQFILSV